MLTKFHLPSRGALALLSITNISLIYQLYLIRDRYLCKRIAIDSDTCDVRSTVREDPFIFYLKKSDSRQCYRYRSLCILEHAELRLHLAEEGDVEESRGLTRRKRSICSAMRIENVGRSVVEWNVSEKCSD